MWEAFKRVGFLESIGDSDAERLRRLSEIRVLRRREPLWADGGDTAFFSFVIRGRVKLVKSSELGRETILDLALPGAMLCTNAVCSRGTYCCSAVAMEDETEVLLVPRDELMGVIEEVPETTRAFLHAVTTRGATLCRRVEELASGQVERRIATLLLRLAEQVGQHRAGEGTWIPVALSRQDLADMCGTTVETAIRVMSRFKRQGLVRTVTRGFVVPDTVALDQVSRGMPATQADA